MSRLVIVTKMNQDGTFDDVGMNNRRPMALKTEAGIFARCIRTKFCGGGDKIRMEWFYTSQHEKPHSVTWHTFDWQEAQSIEDMASVHKGKYKRPVERMLGMNQRCIRSIIGSCHVSKSLLEVARAARPKRLRAEASVELRRGWALCVIQTWKKNRAEYISVISGSV